MDENTHYGMYDGGDDHNDVVGKPVEKVDVVVVGIAMRDYDAETDCVHAPENIHDGDLQKETHFQTGWHCASESVVVEEVAHPVDDAVVVDEACAVVGEGVIHYAAGSVDDGVVARIVEAAVEMTAVVEVDQTEMALALVVASQTARAVDADAVVVAVEQMDMELVLMAAHNACAAADSAEGGTLAVLVAASCQIVDQMAYSDSGGRIEPAESCCTFESTRC
mmetsp:Transcript_1268/g.4335  ORF Transcript_1268/g.4335 Transcript_1268/m.4335 type:complete len:222 (+) Transcript_1268:11924-12589(+)